MMPPGLNNLKLEGFEGKPAANRVLEMDLNGSGGGDFILVQSASGGGCWDILVPVPVQVLRLSWYR